MQPAAGPALAETPDAFEVVASAYRLSIRRDRPLAVLSDPGGRRWLQLVLLAAVHAANGPDGTPGVEPAVIDEGADRRAGAITFRVAQRSTRWRRREVSIACFDHRLEVRTRVEGEGLLADVHLLGGYQPGAGSWGSGFAWTGSDAGTLFSPAPTDPNLVLRPASAPAAIGVVGGGPPGRGNWFFTPGPLVFALSRDAPGAHDPPDLRGDWLALSLVTSVGDATFTNLTYETAERGFNLRLDYDGSTRVAGDWSSPVVVIRPGLDDPYAAIRTHVADIAPVVGGDPGAGPSSVPDWWLEPIFCGWGAQCHLARARGGLPQAYATEAAYDEFLGKLASRGIRPGTIVVDDKWQATYGTGEPDHSKWPNLREWIARRHDAGQRVLLWWKAWDPEGVPGEECVRAADGVAVTVDPGRRAYRRRLEEMVERLLAPDGMGADGLKVDFTASTPSGPGLLHAGTGWGIALLHELLETIHGAAHRARRDALVVTQTPSPLFADVADMIRLNDLLRLGDPDQPADVVDQMTYRAAVVRAACPGLPIDTDDWGVPSLAAWRHYARMKIGLGVPALYYATHLDVTGEALEDKDDALIRETWATWRERVAGRGSARGRGHQQ